MVLKCLLTKQSTALPLSYQPKIIYRLNTFICHPSCYPWKYQRTIQNISRIEQESSTYEADALSILVHYRWAIYSNIVVSQGLEPQLAEPKSVVLPLHHETILLWGERDSNPPTARPVRQFVLRRDLQSRAVISPKFKNCFKNPLTKLLGFSSSEES